MAAPKSFRSQGIVLESKPLGEADLMVTLLTSDEGKLRAVARGARKTTSKLVGHLEPLNRVDISVARGKEFQYVSQAQVLENFLSPENRAGRRYPWALHGRARLLVRRGRSPWLPHPRPAAGRTALSAGVQEPRHRATVFRDATAQGVGVHAGALLLRGLW